MDDFGGYSLWGDSPDFGSFFGNYSLDMGDSQNPGMSWSDYAGNAPLSYAFPQLSPGGLNTDWLNSYIQPQAGAYGGYYQGSLGQGQLPQGPGQNPLGIPQPQSAMNVQPQQQGVGQANPWIGGLLGAAGPMAGLIGALTAGGQGATTGPRPTTAQQANITRGTQLTEQGAMGNLPAQQMQMSLLQALAGGQGLPPGYQQLVEQAFEPQMGSLYEQATRAGRAKGFHDAPGQSPAGGAILGPGLSNLQGQMAAAKLGLMQSLPGLFNTPSQTQAQLANAFAGNAQGAPMAQTTTQPMGPTVANAIGNIFSGAAQGYNTAQGQNQQQNSFNSILQALQGGQRGGLSYT